MSISPPPPRRVAPVARVAVAALALGACDAIASATHTWHGTLLEPPRPAPALALPSAAGRVDLAAERGAVTLVFFGYTRCPDVCPTTLADWARARRALGADTSGVRWVFVSVDPARDTPADADAYAKRFAPAFTGVSGTPAEIATVARAWGVAAPEMPATAHAAHGAAPSVLPGSTPDAAMLAHTAHTFVVDAEGRLRLLVSPGTRPEDLAADVRVLRR